MARTVDHISDGRVILGVGAGFKEREFLEYGYEFPSAGRRVADLAESLPRIKKRLAALNPPPVGRMPILIAGGGEQKMLRIVAEHADIWNTFAEGDDLVRKLGLLRKYCAEIGRDPSTIERTMASPVLVVGNDAERRAALEFIPEERRPYVNIGPPEQMADALRPYLEAGFTGFTFNNSIYRTPEAIGRVGELLQLVDAGSAAVA
jgi:alkanesulfonate monooxygenase SsuD/methylene tetrahydromethanopterin reductase-like flavin-dependent oxidoreductase (luciferase family)